MSRKLTQRQRSRIKQSQQDRLARSLNTSCASVDEANNEQLKTEPGLVISHFGASLDIETSDGDIVRCKVRSNLPALVTGDQVAWQSADDGSGVVVAMNERRSLLSRPLSRGELRPVAANIDRLFIVISPSPRTPANLIDRYLVACAHDDISPVILLNKIDLLDQAPEMLEELNEYEQLGYRTAQVSAASSAGIKTLHELIREFNVAFVGHSGVGKSSLVQSLLPNETLLIGDISDATGKGKHTTTTARLYHLPDGGNLIDSPGVREYGLWHTTEDDLAKAFAEISNQAAYCKFSNCSHTHEPTCAVKKSVEAGDILERRWQSYLSIKDSMNEVVMRPQS